ncbi:glycoside hydrolase family 3 N-terminal domain-containing protein [Pseudactinotalea sp. Z1748]|uniref:glycoside hydrolase family 3 N-terminal domain-containing protein n=1 Tax=Pseudactinotalea sp. Z1748 TaxID=3413027 RepID=UPI003C7ABC4E
MGAGAVTALVLGSAVAMAQPNQDETDIDAIIEGMTLEQKVGQMFVPFVYGEAIDQAHSGNEGMAGEGVDTIEKIIEEFHPGGIIYFGWSDNLNSPGQIAQLSHDIQQTALDAGAPPLSLAIDQEEGVVVRLPEPSAQMPGSMALGATGSAEYAREAAGITATELSALGINQNYAPIADVNSNALNPVIGVRAFGGDTELVSALSTAQVHGFQDDGGISASVKHFPGHGDTDVDSHYGVPIIEKSEADFRAEDLPPFQAAIEAGVDSMMTAHIVIPALDDSGRPATLSQPILTGLLREEMGYDGVIVTDSLAMDGVQEEFGDDRVPVEAILAGADQMLMPPDLRVAYDGVMDAVADGEITEERIDESVRRILEQKERRGVLADPLPDLDAVDEVMNDVEHRERAQAIADDSVTLLSNDGVLPLDDGSNVLVTGWGDSGRLNVIADQLIRDGHTVRMLRANNPTQAVIDIIVGDAADRDAVVVLTQSTAFETPQNQQDLVAALSELETEVIEVAVRNPYDTTFTAPTEAAMVSYGYAPVSLQAIADVVSGNINPRGELPVVVPQDDGTGEVYPLGHGLDYGTTVVPREPDFEADSMTIPEVEGVTYLVNGDVVEPGEHAGSGTVTVVAQAADGYFIEGRTQSSWQHAFDDAAPVFPPPGPAPGHAATVELGIERLLNSPEQTALLEGKRVGLITNPTGVDSDLTHSMDLLIAGQEAGGYELTALYAPEHGILGGAPAGADVESYVDPRTGLRVWSLYGQTQRPTAEMLEDVDVLLFDIQDIGARFYTYIWTMYYAMDAAAEFDKEFIVLDRPNPLGDRIDGPVLDPALSSFVGLREIPMQHGLTVGELASLFNGEFLDDPVQNLHVVELEGYDPADFVDGYNLPWVLPSPNIPTIETAWVYAGMGLIESLNASEGRGTTKPFLWAGHGDIDEVGAYALAEDLNSRELSGVHFRPMFANPTASKEQGRLSGGVEIHVTDPSTFVPVRTGLHVLEALYNTDGLDWREGTVYPDQQCSTPSDICWIDRLTGTRDVRMQLEDGVDPDEIIAGWSGEIAAFDALADDYRLYAQDGGGEDPGDGDAKEAAAAMEAALAGYVNAGDVAGPVVNRLTNAVEQAQRHLDSGRTAPAVAALNRFVHHLENPNQPDTVSDSARADLVGQAGTILELLE